MRKLLSLVGVLIAVAGLSRPAASIEVSDLYRAQTIVTGQREETRAPGIRQCLLDVAVKVSGNPRLLSDPLLTALNTEPFVASYRYRDRLEGRPIRDEQGARDRPHDLTVDFDPTKIDGMLGSLGTKPWGRERPRVAVFVTIRQGSSAYVLSQDGERGFGQRAALLAASERIGVPTVLPQRSDVRISDVAARPKVDFAELGRSAHAMGADVPLFGDMTFSDDDHGWIVEWRFPSGQRVVQWGERGVNFDAAFRTALYGVAQILSENGDPR